LLKIADRYATWPPSPAARGLESPTRLRLNLFAAMCYRMALAHDPANPDAVLQHWHAAADAGARTPSPCIPRRGPSHFALDDSGNAYRELGLSLAKQEKNRDVALTGVAGGAYQGSVQHEDLGRPGDLLHHAQSAVDAAHAAATTLLIAERDTRLTVMRQVLVDARKRVANDANLCRRPGETARAGLTGGHVWMKLLEASE
jgi:hypothetical protein